MEHKSNMDLVGTWINQRGSRLEINEDRNTMISGRFTSTKGRAARGHWYPVYGIRNGNLVSFAVSFEDADQNLHAITTFSGRVVSNELPQIHTLWILAREFEDAEQRKPTQVWNTFLTNTDVFTLERSE